MSFPTGLILDVNPNSFGLSDGASVTQLTDYSGNSHHGTQATGANRGAYRANVQNGKGAVEFDGVNDNYSFGNVLSGLTQGEVFLIYYIPVEPPSSAYETGLWTTSATGGFPSTHFPFHLDSIIYDGWGSTTRYTVGNPTPSLTSPRLYNVSSASNDWKARIDTTQLFSSNSSTVAFPNPFVFGQSSDSIYKAKGKLLRMLIFNRVLSDAERQGVEYQLGSEYALAYYVPLLLSAEGLELYCEPKIMSPTNGANATALTDYSGNHRHLTALSSYPTFQTGVINGKPVVRWNGSQNPLKNTAQFAIRCGWILAKYNGATFADYKGLLSDLFTNTILVSNNAGTNFFDVDIDLYEFRSNDRIYPMSAAPAPVNAFKLIFFKFWSGLLLDGVQLGQQTTFTARKWNGDVALLALYSMDFHESDIRLKSQAIADEYNLTLADVYSYQADVGGTPENSEQSVNFYDPPEGNRISEVLDNPKRNIDLKFSIADQTEVKYMKAFHAAHYGPALPFIYRDYRFTPPEDIEGYLDSPYDLDGSNNDFTYSFKIREK